MLFVAFGVYQNNAIAEQHATKYITQVEVAKPTSKYISKYISTLPTTTAIKMLDAFKYLNMHDYNNALKILKPLAIQGDPEAQFIMGTLYDEGKGVNKDYKQASYWYQKSANQNFDSAQYHLGNMYFLGLGVPKNIQRALYWYRKSAAQLNPISEYILGILYARGKYVPYDNAISFYWLGRSAIHGFDRAQFLLGVLYLKGVQDVIPQNKKLATKLFRLAAKQGNVKVQKIVKYVELRCHENNNKYNYCIKK